MSAHNMHQQFDKITIHELQGDNCILYGDNWKAYYRISLITGKGLLHLKNGIVKIESPALVISAPGIDLTWNPLTKKTQVYACVIAPSFVRHQCFNWISESNLFSINEPQLFTLKQEELQFLHSLFENILNTKASNYRFKDELIQVQMCVLFHTLLIRKTSEDHLWLLKPFCQYAEFEAITFPTEARLLYFN